MNDTEPTKEIPTKKQPSSRAFSAVGVIIFIIMSVVLAWGGWCLIQMKKTQHAQAVQQNEQLSFLKQELVALQTQLSVEKKAAKTPHRHWTLNEIRYLVHLAQVNLQYTGEKQTAIALLTAAEQRLNLLNDSRLLVLQKAIAADKKQLIQTKGVDKDRLLTQLNTMGLDIKQLPKRRMPNVKHVTPVTSETDKTASTWREHWHKSLERLQHLIVIRRLDKPFQPILADAQLTLLMQQLQLALQEAQWAVLQRDQTLYETSLEKMRAWLEQYYAGQVDDLVHSLETLQKEKITSSLPTLKNTLAVLERIQNEQGENPA